MNLRLLRNGLIVAAIFVALIVLGSRTRDATPPPTAAAPPTTVTTAATTPAAASSPASAEEPLATTTPSDPAAVPSVSADDAPKNNGARRPRRSSSADVERLARTWATAWTSLEAGARDPQAQRVLAAAITPEFAQQLAAARQPQRTPQAKVRDVKLMRLEAGRWMAIVRLSRDGSTEYLQLEISRTDGELLIHGFSD